jgi:predicted  nucleic acid-binding Zn-ribbon protein
MSPMPDAAPVPEDSDPAEPVVASTPTTAARLLALQMIDTESDQLRIRLERLDERAVQAERAAAVLEWERTLEAGERRIAELTATIEDAERKGVEQDAQKARFEEQMKTIIAPREAEALMHEMEMLDTVRDANETAELEALEEQSSLDDALVAHRAGEQGHRDALAEADSVLAVTVAEIALAQEELESKRVAARAELDDSSLRTYDRIRAHLGVAVAALEGKMCAGCHLDLSAAEIDIVRETAVDGGGLADCPQCGRILVP